MEERNEGQERPNEGVPTQPQKLSAAFLPYDDERLWVGMPQKQRGSSRTSKRQKRRLNRPRSFGRRQLAAAALTLALPISAFAVTGVLSGGSEIPIASVASSSPTLPPSPMLVEIQGLRTEVVSSSKVELSWDAPADMEFTFTVYRDEVVIGETTQTSFVDRDVEAAEYHYYSIVTSLPDGTVASSPQLLVSVPSDTGEVTQVTSSAPPRIVTAPTSPSPSPSKSPSPTKSKIVWPSIDLSGGGGGGGGGTIVPSVDACAGLYQSTDPLLPCYQAPVV